VEQQGDCYLIEEVDEILDVDEPAPPTTGNPPTPANTAAAPTPALTTNTTAAPATTTTAAAESPSIIMNKRVGNMLVARLNGIDNAMVQLKEDVYHKIETQAHFADLKLDAIHQGIKRVLIQPPHQMYADWARRQGQSPAAGTSNRRPLQPRDPNAGDMPAPPSSPDHRRGTGRSRNELVAQLCDKPANLWELWREYTHGTGGRKPAKDLSPTERGVKSVKFRYCRRKCFWKVVCKYVKAGYCHTDAISAIYNHYGEKKSVSNILGSMQRDQSLPHGCHEKFVVSMD